MKKRSWLPGEEVNCGLRDQVHQKPRRKCGEIMKERLTADIDHWCQDLKQIRLNKAKSALRKRTSPRCQLISCRVVDE
jgi:hypothetical protein